MWSFLKSRAKGQALQFVFIFTYGRSGSTLLSGYLNAMPGVCIRGENYMAIAHLCAFYRSIKAAKGHTAKKSGMTVHPWYGIDDIDLEGLRERIRDMFVTNVLCPPEGTRVVGFKEIRINFNEVPDFDGLLDDIVEIFGDVKFVFNHRRVSDVARSKWWEHTLQSHARVRSMDMRLERSRYSQTGKVFHVHYERFISDPSHARALSEFVGVAFDKRIYEQILAVKHSY